MNQQAEVTPSRTNTKKSTPKYIKIKNLKTKVKKKILKQPDRNDTLSLVEFK